MSVNGWYGWKDGLQHVKNSKEVGELVNEQNYVQMLVNIVDDNDSSHATYVVKNVQYPNSDHPAKMDSYVLIKLREKTYKNWKGSGQGSSGSRGGSAKWPRWY